MAIQSPRSLGVRRVNKKNGVFVANIFANKFEAIAFGKCKLGIERGYGFDALGKCIWIPARTQSISVLAFAD